MEDMNAMKESRGGDVIEVFPDNFGRFEGPFCQYVNLWGVSGAGSSDEAHFR